MKWFGVLKPVADAFGTTGVSRTLVTTRLAPPPRMKIGVEKSFITQEPAR
jgi:hypothetical protein